MQRACHPAQLYVDEELGVAGTQYRTVEQMHSFQAHQVLAQRMLIVNGMPSESEINASHHSRPFLTQCCPISFCTGPRRRSPAPPISMLFTRADPIEARFSNEVCTPLAREGHYTFRRLTFGFSIFSPFSRFFSFLVSTTTSSSSTGTSCRT
jgi:hypothetical protein